MTVWILMIVLYSPLPFSIGAPVAQAFTTRAECQREADTKNTERHFNVPDAWAVCFKAETGRVKPRKPT